MYAADHGTELRPHRDSLLRGHGAVLHKPTGTLVCLTTAVNTGIASVGLLVTAVALLWLRQTHVPAIRRRPQRWPVRLSADAPGVQLVLFEE